MTDLYAHDRELRERAIRAEERVRDLTAERDSWREKALAERERADRLERLLTEQAARRTKEETKR